jgi:hypothetical protein
MEYVLTDEHIEELREHAKYAIHNGGTVAVNCHALLLLLPEPKKPEPPSPFVEADLIPDTAAPVIEGLQASAAPAVINKDADKIDASLVTSAAAGEAHAEAVGEVIHEETGAKTEVVNGIPIVDTPESEDPGIPDVKKPSAAPEQDEPSTPGDPKPPTTIQ